MKPGISESLPSFLRGKTGGGAPRAKRRILARPYPRFSSGVAVSPYISGDDEVPPLLR